MIDEIKESIMKNTRSLENKLRSLSDDNDIRIAYDYATKIKNGLLSLHQDRYFGQPHELTAPLLTHCDGYVDEGIAVLIIGEALPHTKTEMTGTVLGHWQSCIHAAVSRLAEHSPVTHFDRAMVGIHVAMPRGANNSRIWDTSNRAINLILNNLKGIFFPDDNIEHMAFAVVGSWAEHPETTIFVGDFVNRSEQIITCLKAKTFCYISHYDVTEGRE